MKSKSIFFVITILILLLNSCNKISPSGSWEEFQSEKIVENFSDQGPYGGIRKIEWKNIDVNSNISNFLKFANQNEWKLIDSLSIENIKLNETESKKLNDYTIEIIEEEIIPNLSTKKSKIYIFTTGWIRIKPGNENQTEQNGFLISDSENDEIKIIHEWGE